MMLKQSTSAVVLVGPVLDSAGAAVTTAVIGDFSITKNGTTAAMSGNTISHVNNGHYAITLTTTNTDTIGRLSIHVNNTAMAMPVFRWDVLAAIAVDLITGANLIIGTATAGGASTLTMATGVTYGTNILARSHIRIIAGTGAGQSRIVLSNTNATPSVITVDTAWTTNPDSTSVYIVFGHTGSDVRLYQGSNVPVQADVRQYGGAAGTFTGGRPEVIVQTINANVVTASALAADAVAEIADGVWDEVISGHLTAGTTGATLNGAGSAGDPWTTSLPGSYTGTQAGKILADILVDTGTTLQADLDDIQTRLPAALVSGRMDASVGAMAANTLTASALATDAVTEISGTVATDVWAAATRTLSTAPPTAAAIADAVWDEARTGHTTSGTFGFYLDAAISGISGGSGGSGDASQSTLLAVQTTVNTIATQTGQITGSRLSTIGPVTSGGDILLIVGKDYVTAASNGLTRTITDVGAALSTRMNSATLAAVKRFGAARPNGIGQITGTIASVTHASGVTSIVIEIDRTSIPDSLLPAADYVYQIERETSDGDLVVEVSGNLTLSRRTV